MNEASERGAFEVFSIGSVRSSLRDRSTAPKFGDEGAPDAEIELHADVLPALDGLTVGADIVLITWLHLSRRDTLRVHPRGDLTRPITGVFATRSPDRPNPIGLHRVTVRQILAPGRLLVGPLEAVDGTPVIDIKPIVREVMDH